MTCPLCLLLSHFGWQHRFQAALNWRKSAHTYPDIELFRLLLAAAAKWARTRKRPGETGWNRPGARVMGRKGIGYIRGAVLKASSARPIASQSNSKPSPGPGRAGSWP